MRLARAGHSRIGRIGLKRAALGGLVFLTVVGLAGCGKELPTRSGGSEGYDRVVLAELFTAVWCGNCIYAEDGLDRLYAEEVTRGLGGTPRLAVIQWHPSFGQGDPFAISAADDRMVDYQDIFGTPVGLPMGIFNGATGISSGTPQTYNEYRVQFDQYVALPARVQVGLSIQDDGDHIHPLIQVVAHASFDQPEVEVTAVLVENHVPNTSGMGPEVLSFVARVAQSQAITLAGTEPANALLTLPIAPTWTRRNLYVIAFAQEAGPMPGRNYREVLQAAIVPLVAGDAFDFRLSAPETDIGVPIGGERRIPFEVRNTGSLDDTLTVDLPAALTDVPSDWTVHLVDDAGGVIATPLECTLPIGGNIDDLRVVVQAPSAGTGSVALTVRSHCDWTRADTLRFTLTAGTFDLDLVAEETDFGLTVGSPRRAPFSLENRGTLSDSLRVVLPLELNRLPSGWTVTLAQSEGGPLGTSYAVRVPPQGRVGLGLRVTAGDVGEGSVGVVAFSRGDATLADTLTFTFEARAHNLRLQAEEPQVWVVVGEPALVHFEVRNAGGRDDLARLDLPAELQSLPTGWSVGLGYGDGIEVGTPYWLPLEAGDTATGFGLLIRADAAGQGLARLVARSTGDPSQADTLSFIITADAYGFSLSAPGGTAIDLDLGTPELIPIEIANTGTVDDTLRVDLPAGLQEIPAAWEISLTDAVDAPIAVPLDLPLASGAAQTGWRIRAMAPSEGVATVALVVVSRARPALRDTLSFTLTAAALSEYAFDLTAATTLIHVEQEPSGAWAARGPFVTTSRGLLDDTIRLQASWVSRPPGWEFFTPVVCQGDVCIGPVYDLEIVAESVVDDLYVDLVVGPTTAGTAVVRLTATSLGDPTQTHSLDFTITTEAAARTAQARPAEPTPSTVASARHADAAPRHR